MRRSFRKRSRAYRKVSWCSSASRSEIVVPMLVDGEVAAVLDIDSSRLNTFDEVDRLWLERIVAVLAAVV